MSSSQECPICFDALTTRASVIPPCGHMFHESCLKSAMTTSPSQVCPVCRAPLRSSELVRVMSGLPDPCEVPSEDLSKDTEDVPQYPSRPQGQRRRKLLKFLPERVRHPRRRQPPTLARPLAPTPMQPEQRAAMFLQSQMNDPRDSSDDIILASEQSGQSIPYALAQQRQREPGFSTHGSSRFIAESRSSYMRNLGVLFVLVGLICTLVYIVGWLSLLAVPTLTAIFLFRIAS